MRIYVCMCTRSFMYGVLNYPQLFFTVGKQGLSKKRCSRIVQLPISRRGSVALPLQHWTEFKQNEPETMNTESKPGDARQGV